MYLNLTKEKYHIADTKFWFYIKMESRQNENFHIAWLIALFAGL